MAHDTAYGRTTEDVLERYVPGGPSPAHAHAPRSGAKAKKPRAAAARGKGRAKRTVFSVAYTLPPRVGRAHVTHTTATDARAAQRDVLRHLPEGTRISETEPTRRARRAPPKAKQGTAPRTKRGAKQSAQRGQQQAAK
jgi:hypothetical protein